MKDISTALQTHIEQEVTTLAVCWEVACQDGDAFRFTNHDRDIEYDGDTYEASTGFLPSSVESSRTLTPDNLEAMSVLDSDSLDSDDLLTGKFDRGVVSIFLINWEDTSMGVMWIAKNWEIGEVTVYDNHYVAELRSTAQRLDQTIVDLYSTTCRAIFGDDKCGINKELWKITGTITAVDGDIPNMKFTVASAASSSGSSDLFVGGLITFASDSTGGENAGLSMEIREFDPDTGEFTLFEPMPHEVDTGDAITAYYGCDKIWETCRDRFDNQDNFRGEPKIPGYDKTLWYPDPK